VKALASSLVVALLVLAHPGGAQAQTANSGYAFLLDNADSVSGATVVLETGEDSGHREIASVETAEDGFYELNNIPRGSYRIRADGRFVDLSGEEFHVLLSSAYVDVGNDSLQIDFAFSLAAIKVEQAALDFVDRVTAKGDVRDERSSNSSDSPPPGLSPRVQMIACRIRVHPRLDVLETCSTDRRVDLR